MTLRVEIDGLRYVPQEQKIPLEALRLIQELVSDTEYKSPLRTKASRLQYLLTDEKWDGKMTVGTQMIIGTNSDEDVHLEHVESDGKHGFWITFGEYHRPLVSSQLAFESQEEAMSSGREIISEARKQWAVA